MPSSEQITFALKQMENGKRQFKKLAAGLSPYKQMLQTVFYQLAAPGKELKRGEEITNGFHPHLSLAI